MTVVDQPRQRSSHQTPERIINVVGAVIVKDGKYSARNEARADRLPDAGNSLEEKSNLMKQPDRRCTAKSKRN